MKGFAATVCSAVVLFTLAGNAFAAFPGANGKILFSSTRTGNWDVFAMNPDGTAQTNLSSNPGAADVAGAWSPDGQRIAFVSDPVAGGVPSSIYVMNADGSGATKLTDGLKPAWSPDGTKIAFDNPAAGAPLGNSEIYVINADGSGLTNLSNDPSANDIQPAWSPDGRKIAFAKAVIEGAQLKYGIYVMNADGTAQTQLTNPYLIGDRQPDWSPDGQKIAYTSFIGDDEEGIFSGIFVMDSDGGNQTQLTPFTFDGSPHWSPDGTRIVFASEPGISTINADGTARTDIVVRSRDESLISDDWGRVPSSGPQRSDFKNAAQFCRAKREFIGRTAFDQAYGSNGLGGCVTATGSA